MATYLGKEEQKQLPCGVENGGRWWGHSQEVGKIEPCYVVEVPAVEYFAHVAGKKVNEHGWMYSTLHDGKKRCARWLPDTEGGTDSASVQQTPKRDAHKRARKLSEKQAAWEAERDALQAQERAETRRKKAKARSEKRARLARVTEASRAVVAPLESAQEPRPQEPAD